MGKEVIIFTINSRPYFFFLFFTELISGFLVIISIFIVDFTTRSSYDNSRPYGYSVYSPAGNSYKTSLDYFCNETMSSSKYSNYDSNLCKFYKGLYYGEISYLVCASISSAFTFI